MDSQPVTKTNRVESSIKREVITNDYKKWEGTPSYNDLMVLLDKCYDDYIKYSKDLTQPQSFRLGYLDQAAGIEKVRDYIQRQVK